MTKPLSALFAALLFACFGPLAAAQTVSGSDSPEAQTERQMPGWAYDFDVPTSDLPPVVMERSIDIALGLGVLGQQALPYRVGLAGPGNVGLVPAPVPEGWVVIRRCMERGAPTAAQPDGPCLVYEMRELTGNPYAIAWD